LHTSNVCLELSSNSRFWNIFFYFSKQEEKSKAKNPGFWRRFRCYRLQQWG